MIPIAAVVVIAVQAADSLEFFYGHCLQGNVIPISAQTYSRTLAIPIQRLEKSEVTVIDTDDHNSCFVYFFM